MDTKSAYNNWAATYDTVQNKTRDLELMAIKEVLTSSDFSKVLEIGCGTGKNTSWLQHRAGKLLALDFSEGMLTEARKKINATHVDFRQADLTQAWPSSTNTLIICSLVLEHIKELDFIFEQAAKSLETGGIFYICELHPYKQLEGSRAKFEQSGQLIELEYFIHHISDFMASAKNKFNCIELKEWFDDGNRNSTPRLISFLFQKIDRA
ncbi:MAG: class I SAM-dependent methyltransferase [Bacteroidetes bacterium]|nr:class I SAM-dependent methyltransferase [Bacteroidota bacterium]